MSPTTTTALAWIERWDRQQDSALPDRETLFTVITDAVASAVGRPDPIVIDLACGPGSLGARIHRRLPAARIIGVDADPVLLDLARAAHDFEFVDHNLDDPEWVAALHLSEPADAIVSTTALHWLRTNTLARVYTEAATLLRPGGLLLNGDDMIAASPVIDRLDLEITRRRMEHAQPADDWQTWWTEIEADPELATATADRRTRTWHRPETHEPPLDLHLNLLREAGFRDVGQIWQYGRSRVIAAIKSP
ncbi:methyltransferase family protein [Nocardia tenerifensis]|uniref:Methyltransferase family protein n=1 Tax=Nocardia tenerifensis TaxID=228006 RepID=A0A318KF23_9NOCA|nr:class I SAM-dependent methyltransferase [Nocardia tenerifensis]PXX58147.1 methyltransferase family protein [Nocardia tenerifensis]